MDPQGTCHQVGCPGKGSHPPHGIGTGTWVGYELPDYCLGYPVIGVDLGSLDAVCSIEGVKAWRAHPEERLTPAVMAQLVDQHKNECPNRKAAS